MLMKTFHKVNEKIITRSFRADSKNITWTCA